jgi:hypothetical protein
MGAWMVGLLERDESGALHAVGPSSTFTWGEQRRNHRQQRRPEGTTLRWVDSTSCSRRS